MILTYQQQNQVLKACLPSQAWFQPMFSLKKDQPSPIPTSGENDNLSPSESPTNQIDFTSFSPSAGEIHSNSPTSLRSSQQTKQFSTQ